MLLAPQDPTGYVTNRRVTSVSFFQHKVIPLFPPLPSQHYGMCQSLSWQHSSHPTSSLLSMLYLLNFYFRCQFCSNLVLYSMFHPFPAPFSLLVATLEHTSYFFTVMPLSGKYSGTYLLETWMQMNAELGSFLLKELACFPDSTL